MACRGFYVIITRLIMKAISEAPDMEALRLQAEICKAIAHPKRLGIVYALRVGEKGAGELAAELGLSLPALSQHLRVLRERGLVVARQEGRKVFYRLADERLLEACETMRALLKGWLTRLEGISGKV